MIENGYLMVGVIYLVMALFYAISLLVSFVTVILDMFDSQEVKKRKQESKDLQYKIYWYFNNIRYMTFMFLCAVIGIIYIRSHQHELHAKVH